VYYLLVLLAGMQRNFAQVLLEMQNQRRDSPTTPGSRTSIDLPLIELWAKAEQGQPTDAAPLQADMAKFATGPEEAPLRMLAQAVFARRAELAGDNPARDAALAAAQAEISAHQLGPYDAHLLTQLGLELFEEISARANAPQPGPDGSVVGKLLHAREHSLRFACRCGAEYTVKSSRAGKATSCPKCRTRLLVPTPK
jgi:DNA-directed RNA polymerase subunit RPC12/RpoP